MNSIPSHSEQNFDANFLSIDSAMAREIQSHDWSQTPLGPIEGWPQSLRTTVSLCLASNFPINIVWGPESIQIYNDGYRVLCGDKHPDSLGMDYRECWASAWSALDLPFKTARAGHTSFLENQRMFLFRNDYLEETFFTFSLSPIRDESGNIGGLFHPVTETTATMLSERRTRVLRDLAGQLGNAENRAALYTMLMQTLAQFELDLPFTLLYERDAESGDYLLQGAAGVDSGTPISAERLSADAAGGWPMQQLLASSTRLQVSGLRARLGDAACGPYDEAPDTCMLLPIAKAGAAQPELLLVAGASARLPLDDTYCGFYDLLAAAVQAALARVDSAEEERKRAEMLAEIDRAKTVFFSNISHEFRTPLTLMLGPLEESLAEPGLSGDQLARLEIANRNALRLLRLVNSLLDFSRLEAGRIEARYTPVDLPALTADLASNFRSACERAGLALIVDCEPLPHAVYVDMTMWEKIVLNLLSNAFKFTLEGSIRVTLREAGGMAELTVIDTGVGIPAADIGRVFERFHRVEEQHGRSVEGSGIGLSLARELVQLHGGSIGVASEQDRGTAFTVRLPFGSSHLAADQIGQASAHDYAGAETSYSQVQEALRWLPDAALPENTQPVIAHGRQRDTRIVLAEDNADMRAYVGRILSEAGYQVTAVTNGREAFEAASTGAPPDLVLTDVMMPEMDGFALLAALRAQQSTRDTVVILLSARAGEEARLEGLNAGADDYLVKPFGARELRARIDGAVNMVRLRREAAARELALQLEVESARGRAALTRSEAHAGVLFRQTGVGMAEAGLDGRLLNVNGRYCAITGRAAQDLVGTPFNAIVHLDDAHASRALFDALAGGARMSESEHRLLRADGASVWVQATVTPIDDGAGASATVLISMIDVTERKRAELALREEGQRKDEFLAMLAHELRNPLAPIRAAAELMRFARLDEARAKRTSEVINRQVGHMTALIDDLLDVSRVTRGLVEITSTPQEMHAIVAQAVEQVRPLIEAQRHSLAIELDPASAHVSGDEKRLVQIVANLLNNAAKYTPPQGRILVRGDIDGDTIRISVEDNGIGIAPELQSRVFDLFAQAERTPDRSQGGLGLGLALVKSLAQLHGGSVACYSDGPDQGSRFVVELPRIAPPSSYPSQAGAAPGAKRDGKCLDILLVDDNADAAFMLQVLLEEWGHTVRVEHNAEHGLRRAAEQAPDVAILDIGLPDMDGNAMARLLRTQPATSSIVLAALTGYGQEADRTRAFEAGFNYHLVKPVEAAALLATINSAIGLGKSGGVGQSPID